ncbi:methyltransferase domain-containing protein [Maritimibacter sp. DP1N21-5]|uniref:methyltransferase domain-containing protein n=1 Tax=Maritimibacter sp. DP1N21-5 TaxID=2836867 RepID=UPI001C464FFD|nr:methyltransferase domain-containing protein [Maritimibacter sp. DP1N21-5]MBV7410228.1 methyltransferase domain-containing protein [Maritimibacter sp. DP1N21-5]
MTSTDWDPARYTAFRGLRLRPAVDLAAQIGDLPDGPVIDLGCGAGSVGPLLASRFPTRDLIGVDGSPNMLAEAETTGVYTQLTEADVLAWSPDRPVALVYSNALANWLPDHEALFPKWARWLAPGGTLAVQMPRQYFEPSHALTREIAEEMFPERFDFRDWVAPVATAADYAAMLEPLGEVKAWESTYVQSLGAVAEGHPVRAFTQSTVMRPFVARLNEAEARDFLAACDAALAGPYPVRSGGTVHFPFRRVFFTLTVPA